MPTHREPNPISMKASGNLTEAAVSLSGAEATREALVGLSAADMGKEASIFLLFGLPSEPAFFQVRIQVNRPPIRPRVQRSVLCQPAQSLEYPDHRLRRLQSAGVH